MTTLIQKNRFRRFEFSIKEDGVLVKQKYFLRINSNEQFYSFYDLGIDLVKKSNNEGIPTLLIIGAMTIATAYVAIANLSKKLSLSLLFFVFIVFYAFVIIYTIQKYLTSTYNLPGGKLTITFLRYSKANELTLQFIEKVKAETKKALVVKYNSLINHLKPNDRFQFEPLPTGIVLSDDEFRLLKLKVDLLYNNIIFEEDEDLEEENEE